MNVTLKVDVGIAAAMRAVLREHLTAVRGSLCLTPPRARLTLAEFETMQASDWPDDLRTVHIEQLEIGIAAFDKALSK